MKAEEQAEKMYPTWRNGICDDFNPNSAYYGFIEGYQQAETELLWKLCEVRTLRLKYLHNEEALKAIEDVFGIFKDTLEILDKK